MWTSLLKHHPSEVLVESPKGLPSTSDLSGLKSQTLFMQLGSCWNLSSILCPSRYHFQPGSLEAWPIHILYWGQPRTEGVFVHRFWEFLLLGSSLPQFPATLADLTPNFYLFSPVRRPAKQEMWVWSLNWKDPWRRKWPPTPVFLPGKFRGQRSLVGYGPWAHKSVRHDSS